MRWSAIIRNISNINLSPVKYDLTEKKHDASPGKQVLSGAGVMFSQVTGFLKNIAKILQRITKKYPTNEKCDIIQLLYTTR